MFSIRKKLNLNTEFNLESKLEDNDIEKKNSSEIDASETRLLSNSISGHIIESIWRKEMKSDYLLTMGEVEVVIGNE